MTTTASAIEHSVASGLDTTELATITPVYAAVRAHRPLKGRMGGRSALFGSTIFAGAFGLFAAEAIAQQYNLPGSGGFTDVSSSINVVTDAGAGNIRVILADGVSFLAQPGQYSLNPLTNQLQVSTDVLLGAYTGGAPVQAAQTTQVITATQAFTPPPVYAANAPLTLPQQTISGPQFTAPVAQQTYQPQVFTAGQYATQPSIVGGYQMQPSGANIAYNPPQVANLNPQPTQYVPAYSAGAQFAQTQPVSTFGSPTASTFGTAGTFGGDTFGGIQPIPVTQVVPTEEVAIAPVAAAAAGGLFGLPTWAVIGGGVAAAGAGILALSSLGGGESTSTGSGTGSSLNVSQQAFLSDPAVQAALGNTNAGNQVTSGTSSGSTSSTSSGSTSSGSGITVSGGSSGGGTSTGSTSTSGASATISAGSEDQDITGTSGDDTVTFEAAEDAEEFNSLDLSGGDDLVILQDMDDDLTPEDLNNVENVEVQVDTAGKTLDMSNAGDDIEKLTVDANSKTITINNVDAIDTVAVTDAGSNLVTIEDVDSGNSVALTESDNAKITSGSVLTLTVNEVNTAVEIENVTDLTINAADGSDNSFELTATDLENLNFEGSGAVTITNDIGGTNLPDVTNVDGSAASGPLNIAINGTDVEDVDTGSAGDMLEINGSHADATYNTNGGNDTVEISAFGTDAQLDTGSGGDKIELDVALTSTDQKIDGGDGSDTLEVTVNVASGDFDNIETLEIGGGATAINLALFDSDLTTVEVSKTATVTLSNITEAQEIELVNGANVVLASGTDNEANITVSGAATVANTSAQITTLNFSGTNAAAATVSLTGTATQVVNVLSANGDLAFTGSAVSTAGVMTSFDSTAVDVDITVGSGAASGMDSVSSASFGGGDDTVFVSGGAAGADISMGAGDDTSNAASNAVAMDYEGGAGKDAITLNAANTVQDDIVFGNVADFVTVGSAVTANLDTVAGFVTAEDKIDLNALNLTGISDEANITDAFNAVNNGTVDVAFADSGGNTYVYVDLGGGNIGAFEITGNTTVAETDFNL